MRRMAEASEQGAGEAELLVTYDIREAYALAERARETFALFRDALIPQTRAALAGAEISYGVGKANFSDYILTFEACLRAKLREAEDFSEYEKQVARITMLTGADVKKAREESHE